MYKVETRVTSQCGTQTVAEYYDSWDDVLWKRAAFTIYVFFLFLGILLYFFAGPFYALGAVYQQWKFGGKRCSREEVSSLKESCNRDVLKNLEI